jgi:hypothetical protein
MKSEETPLLIKAIATLQQSVIENPLAKDDKNVGQAIEILQEAAEKIKGILNNNKDWPVLERQHKEILQLLVGFENFDPHRSFDSVEEAITYINRYSDPEDRLFETLRSNFDNGEFGFARELLYDFGNRES